MTSELLDWSGPPRIGALRQEHEGLVLRYDPRDEPRVEVRFRFGERDVKAVALIDSGSSHTTIPQSLADWLKLPLEESAHGHVTGGLAPARRIPASEPRDLVAVPVFLDGREGPSVPLDVRVVADPPGRHRDYDVQLGRCDFMAAFTTVAFELLDRQQAQVRLLGIRPNPLGE